MAVTPLSSLTNQSGAPQAGGSSGGISNARRLELLGQARNMGPRNLATSGGSSAFFGKDSNITEAERAELLGTGSVSNQAVNFGRQVEGFNIARSGGAASSGQRSSVSAFNTFLQSDASLGQAFQTGKTEFQRQEDLQQRGNIDLKALRRQFNAAKSLHFKPTLNVGGIEVSNDQQGFNKLKLERLKQQLGSDFTEFQQITTTKNQKEVERARTKISRLEQQIADIQGLSESKPQNQRRNAKQIRSIGLQINRERDTINDLTLGGAGEEVFSQGQEGQAAAAEHARAGAQRKFEKGNITEAQRDEQINLANLTEQFELGATEGERSSAKASLQSLNQQRMANETPSNIQQTGPVTVSSVTGGEVPTPAELGGAGTDQTETAAGPRPSPTAEVNQSVVDKFAGADANTLLQGIQSGEISPDSADATWRALYRDGFATPEQVEAHNTFQQSVGGNQASGFRDETTSTPGGEPDLGMFTGSTTDPNDSLKSFIGGGEMKPTLTQEGISNALFSGKITPAQAFGALSEVYNIQADALNEAGMNELNTMKQSLANIDQLTLDQAVGVHASMMNLFSMFDDQEKLFKDIGATQETAAQASFDAQSDRTELERDIAIQETEREREQSTLNFQADMIRQTKENERQRIIGQTWSGVVGGFDTATHKRLATASQTGIDLMRELTKQNNVDNAKFGDTFRNIQSRFLSDINILTTQKDEQIATIQTETATQVAAVMQNKALTQDEKTQELNNIASNKVEQTNTISEAITNSINKVVLGKAQLAAGIKMQMVKDNKAKLNKVNNSSANFFAINALKDSQGEEDIASLTNISPEAKQKVIRSIGLSKQIQASKGHKTGNAKNSYNEDNNADLSRGEYKDLRDELVRAAITQINSETLDIGDFYSEALSSAAPWMLDVADEVRVSLK